MDNIVKYSIIGKHYNGLEIDTFLIENSEHKSKSVPLSDIIKLARSGKIKGVTAILDINTGEYSLSFDDSVSSIGEIENTLSLELVARLVVDNKCLGYKAQDSNGKAYKLSISKVWDLALQGSIKGVGAKIINKHKVLLSSNGSQLEKLPILQGKN